MSYEYCVVTPRGDRLVHTRSDTPEAAWQEFCGKREKDRALFRNLADDAGYKVITVPRLANDRGA